MLEQNKEIYQESADNLIPNWKTMNKNELIINAANCTDERLKNGYVAAIMLRYWNKLDSYYYKCKLVTTPEDIHTWLIKSVMYALERKPWEDPKSSIYNDPNGPDKVINRFIESRRLTFYQQLNRYKRKISSMSTSLDSLTDDYKDIFTPTYEESVDCEYDDFVISYFKKKDYFLAFLVDAIIYEDVLDSKGLNRRKFSSHLKNIDEFYCTIFASRYNLKLEDVLYSLQFINNYSSYQLKNKIEYNLIRLKSIISKGDY